MIGSFSRKKESHCINFSGEVSLTRDVSVELARFLHVKVPLDEETQFCRALGKCFNILYCRSLMIGFDQISTV